MNQNSEWRVAAVAEISGRGLAIFFEQDPSPVPDRQRLRIRIVRPDGTETYAEASREFARKIPPGEVIVLLAANLTEPEVPIGSVVSIIA